MAESTGYCRTYLIIPDGPRPTIFCASLGATKEMYRPYMTEEQRRFAQKRPVPASCDGKGPPAALRRLSVEYMDVLGRAKQDARAGRSVLSCATRLACGPFPSQRGPSGIMR